MDKPGVANALGTLGAVCWSIQLTPQIILNYRRGHTTGLQPSMMILWACAGVPLGVYNIVGEFNIALRIQPQILTLLSLVTWAQCGYYGKQWSLTRLILHLLPLATTMALVQTGLIFALRAASSRHLTWPSILMASLAAALLAAGVLRHYVDIYAHRTVRGISFLFVAIDAAGDVFSLASVFFQRRIDVLGIVIYATEFVLWLGILLAGAWYNLEPWAKRRGWREWAKDLNSVSGWRLTRRSARPSAEDADVAMRSHEGHQGAVSEARSSSPAAGDVVLALHDLPSSTSVFRTASGDLPRERHGRTISESSV